MQRFHNAIIEQAADRFGISFPDLPGAALEALDRTAKELSLSRSGAIAYLALERETKTRRFVKTEKRPRKRRAS